MPPSSDDLAVLDRLAEDFVGKLRHGQRPPIQPYADQYPRLATEINRLFPTLVTIEQIGSSVSLPIGSGTSDLPAQIGEYRILRKLGEGGMGVVYEAIQESLGRHVAIKVLPTHARLSKRFRERFRREARAAARLHHSHIVPVFGVGEEADALFYAMQYIPGRGLDAAIPSRRASPSDDQETVTFAGISSCKTLTSSPETTRWDPVTDSDAAHCRWVAEIGAQVAEALAYAHEEGVIHRDVKPSNLLLDDHGSIWVTDFGLAKTSESDGLTEPGDIVGTIRYMAPERFSGWSDARSDVYGLGATLFELLTRRPMFDDPDRGRLIHAILNSETPRPRKLNRSIPRDLETIVLKATAREPGHRYSSAQALADDLKRFVAGMPIHARRHTWAGHAWRLCRRRPFAAITTTSLAASILAMLIGSIVVNIWLDDRQTRIANAQLALREQLRETDQAHKREIAAKRETRQQLIRALQREAETAIWSRRPGVRESVFEALQQVMNLAGEFPLSPERRLELRNLAVASFALMDARTEHRDGPPAPPQSYYTPDRTHFAFSPTAGGVIVTEDATGREVAQAPDLRSINLLPVFPRWPISHRPRRQQPRSERIAPNRRVGLARQQDILGTIRDVRGLPMHDPPRFTRTGHCPSRWDGDILLYTRFF